MNTLKFHWSIPLKVVFECTQSSRINTHCKQLHHVVIFYLQKIKKTHYCILQGSIFWPENDIYSPPPSENDIFSPSRDMLFFDSHCGLFALILPYFAFLLPFYFLFSNYLSPFFHFLSPFFLFLRHFPPFSLGLFIFFPPIDIG